MGFFFKSKEEKLRDAALRDAVNSGNVAAARKALDAGATMKRDGQYLYTPLHLATIAGRLECARLLLERGADKEAKDYFGRTPLHHAALNGHPQCVLLLLERGANKDTKDTEDGWTPLHWAARKGQLECARLLLERGADKEAKYKSGQSPLDMAKDEAMRTLLRNPPPCSSASAAATAKRDADAAAAAAAAAAAERAKRQAEADAAAAAAAKAKADAARREAEAAAARNAAETAAAAERAKRQAEADAAAALRIAAAQQAAAAAAAARTEAEAVARQAAEAARISSSSVPDELAVWLASLQLGAHGPRLVAEHKLAFVADCRHMEESELLQSGLAKIEAKRFMSAAAKLGGDTQRLSGVAAALSGAAAAAPAGARVRVRALCVGINAYGSPVPGALGNAVADARAVHEALAKLPGAASTLLTDCSKAAFEAALTDFRDGTGVCTGRGMRASADAPAAALAERTLGLLFFAGHGLQVNGRNYLVPSDFRVPTRNDKLEVMLRDTARACISLELLEEVLEEAGVSAGAVLLDCCRNVPDFLAQLGATRSAGATRALPAGMGAAVPRLADLMVTFATAPGTEALDRSSRLPRHSPFTAALLKALGAPRRLVDLNPFLTDEVAADSAGKQRPHVGGSYGTEAGNLLLG